MKFKPGDIVEYLSHPGAIPHRGVVVRVSDGGYTFVLYQEDMFPKATRPENLRKVD